MEERQQIVNATITPELYFLITKFLAHGPLQDAAEIFPKRTDWTGQEHEQTFTELERQYSHIGPLHLLEICKRIPVLLDKELTPSVSGVTSLLGAGRQSLLRTKETVAPPKNILAHCSRLHNMPVLESIHKKPVNNIVQVLYGRECSGPITRKLAVPTRFYEKLDLLRRTLGHLSAVYCVLFDRSGKYIITGADDLLVKIWSAIDGRLLATFRGASAEITDIAVNLDNTLLAAGSLDRILRVWDMQTGGPIAVLSAHTGMITSVNFCPSRNRELKYLVTTSTDGSVAFWQYCTPRGAKSSFASKPIQFLEKIRPGQAQMICASFSPGGKFLAAGSADHHVRVYLMGEEGPKRILEIEAHNDTVDSIQWAHQGLKFVSGGKDGIAYMWTFESQQWKSTKLNMSDRLPSEIVSEDDSRKQLKVTMVSWDATDKWVITAVNDYSIKVWNSATAKLHKVMTGHTDELFVLESHPIDPHVLVSAGHDGQLFIWDIMEGISIAKFVNHIDGQGYGGIFDAKWSPDGSMIAATDSHGHILMYGFGSGHPRLKLMPKELFFHTDYRPLIRDVNHFVMDEQTQTSPHLMPPPFLVDVDGNPHPPSAQRLVPGRENCTADQLIPNITVGPEGIEVVEERNAVSDIDLLIAALANRHGPGQAPDSNNERDAPTANNRPSNSPRTNGRVARRSGEVEGVRQSSGNWQRDANLKWIRRIYVRPMRYSRLQALRQKAYHAGLQEQETYRREMRRRPMMINTSIVNSTAARLVKVGRGRGRKQLSLPGVTPAYRTRAVRERENLDDEENDVDAMASASSDSDNSSDASVEEDLSGSESTDTESSDYSDWVGTDQALEPPKRSKRKSLQNRACSPTNSDMNQNTERTVGRKKVVIPDGEIPESYRPPEWLSEVVPKKTPYYPQMGDEVVYFRQGHQIYLDAVRAKKVYKVGNNVEPWTQFDLRDHEVVKVIGIKYEIRPPRLCCLKLALLRNDGSFTGQSFTVKYHDMPDVLDFIVLRQTYDTAVRRLWTTGDRFRCMIDDGWWMGVIESRTPLSPEFPHSLFMCFRIRWDNGEYEFMSPWDMEPIDNNRIPAEVGGAVPVLPEELRATLYQPRSEEWPRGDRDATCRRIIAGLEQVMGLAIADPFLAPVDLNIYPEYAYVIEYPIDLTTIKARFENHFYRRLTAAQFDVRYLATNAERFNQSRSHIIKHARIITDLCLRIIKDQNEVDVRAVYHQLMDTYVTTDSDGDNEAGPSTSNPSNAARRSTRLRRKPEVDWRVKCRDILDVIWQSNDAEPFREPVDLIEHPDYLSSIDVPMDLRTVKEELLCGNYSSANDFIKDMRLIFTNSRNYNTNKRSRIYSMTLRLSGLFEDKLQQSLYSWKSTKRRAAKKKTTPSQSHQHRAGPTTRRSTATNANGNNDDDDSDDDDLPLRNGRPLRRTTQYTTSNGVSSSVNTEPVAGPSTSRGHTRRSHAHSADVDQLHEYSTNSSSSSSDSDGSGNESDEEPSIPLSALGTYRSRRRNSDSEDSYKPNRRIIKPKRRRKKRKEDKKDKIKKSNGTTRTGRPPRQRNALSDEDYAANNRNSELPKKMPRRPKRNRRHRDSSSSSDVEPKRRQVRKLRGYGSDNSCNVNNSLVPMERNPLETDSDSQVVRPTRGRKKKNWPPDSPEEQTFNRAVTAPQSSQTVQRRYPQRKPLTDSDISPEEQTTSRRTSNIMRRETRTRVSQEDSEDDQTLSQVMRNNNFRSRPRRNFVAESATNGTNGTTTRTVTRQQIPTSSHRSIPPTHEVIPVRLHQRNSVQEDHNYDEPGPSSRLTRRNNVTLSRHQRNADELDCPTTSRSTNLHRIIPSQSSSISGRLRQRMAPAVTSTLPSSSSRVLRYIPSIEPINEQNDEDDDSDPEDDKPLSQTRLASSSSQTMRNRSYCDDEYLPGPSTSSRSTRALKRQYYNEDTDEETNNGQTQSAKRRLQTSNDTPQTNESDNSDDELPLSVSSRGRIRKITAKARGLFRE
ncbi:Bromodomain and WD repeat-containing protein 1 [Pseudolycoriella hygida]|uniref:Bromodomain and WD repeat-containing protein 1 n=1 Tax=Pseudolycoriella hygida TaxID=35572 RepID=A0A9Q0RWI2_9DIPT|nr:Bromodomain and WD repeat-containing protein 1 [Pseudolycoriella hygida]